MDAQATMANPTSEVQETLKKYIALARNLKGPNSLKVLEGDPKPEKDKLTWVLTPLLLQ
jgi:hypothetical protein